MQGISRKKTEARRVNHGKTGNSNPVGQNGERTSQEKEKSR